MLIDAGRTIRGCCVHGEPSLDVFDAVKRVWATRVSRKVPAEFFFLTSEASVSDVSTWPGGQALIEAGVKPLRFPRGIMPCSAHMIRELLQDGNFEAASNWLHHSTASYIQRHNLYKNNNDDQAS